VLDALVEALTEIALAWEDAGSIAAAEADIPTATDQFLTGLADDRDLHRAEGEANVPLRERILTGTGATDNLSILAAVGAILERFTAKKAHLFDSILDRWYVSDPQEYATYHSFIGRTPRYLDRLYPSDAALNDGVVRPQSEPGGSYAFGDRVGRAFVLRVPDISPIDTVHAFCFDQALSGPGYGATPYGLGLRMFIGDGTQSHAASFISSGNRSARAVYQAIADKVNTLCGHGVRWMLVVDPKLT
jgi:hypothetical protein